MSRLNEAICTEFAGRPATPGRRRAGILVPYLPSPVAHANAERTFYLLREAAKDFDIYLFSMEGPPEPTLLELCTRVWVFHAPERPRFQWPSLSPPETNQLWSRSIDRRIRQALREHEIGLLQVESTQLGRYPGDILVAHDIVSEAYRRALDRQRDPSVWWACWRWRRFELASAARRRALVVTREKDAGLLPAPRIVVIPHGIDLDRFSAEPDTPGLRVLFIAPGEQAAREIWPLIRRELPPAECTVAANSTARSDVRRLCAGANVVVVPAPGPDAPDPAILAAMAMRRGLVSTTSACHGCGLEHGTSAWLADSPAEIAAGVVRLLSEPSLRSRLATNARAIAVEKFGWERLGDLQRRLWRDLLPKPAIRIRPGTPADLHRVVEIQASSGEAAQWDAGTYLGFDFVVAELERHLAAFMVTRTTAHREREILNIAVAPEFRRMGLATALIASLESGEIFLEVRESNRAAQSLYASLGFAAVGRRPAYYDHPPEAAIVMKATRNA